MFVSSIQSVTFTSVMYVLTGVCVFCMALSIVVGLTLVCNTNAYEFLVVSINLIKMRSNN